MSQPHALIVGASRGIGLGLAREFARRGWKVVATARDPGNATELAALAADSNGQVGVVVVDTADVESSAALAEALKNEVFDLVLINAGVGGPRDTSTLTVSDGAFTALFVTNALAPVRLAEMLVARVRPTVGVVAFMTSILGSVEGASGGGFELYRASKAALNSFTRSFAARHKDKDFTVLSLHPGWVKTDMGGPNAPVSIEESTGGLADVIDRARSERADGYFDYTGAPIPW